MSFGSAISAWSSAAPPARLEASELPSVIGLLRMQDGQDRRALLVSPSYIFQVYPDSKNVSSQAEAEQDN